MKSSQPSSDDHHYSKQEARKIFQKALKDGGWVSRKHARLRMQERKIDNNDILNLAKTGVVLNEPELDINTNQMTYRIESQRQNLKVVFSILGPEKVRLITVLMD